ncbi:cytidylyltransferase domain-containing protein [Candidatus Pelagibacter bacterium nBUS_28]|uniref:acylneuraminate cytidylyltransferase family protein n=1 Tax=Candidatus Pelagibacter bacterium nBUS_28 TaxID=3374189 RepID=UPI003EBB8076|tara:strand:+ start:222 stop:899 length:678 start_codon:yes stop_codon:yes gene_type:complete
MRIAIIIPTRKGSKSIKNKNLRLLNNKPLAEHTFISTQKINLQKFILSDDKKMKKIAKKYNIITDYVRPRKVSKDKSSLVDTLVDFISFTENNKLFKFDTLLILQVTSPLRTKKDIEDAIKYYKKNKFKSLFSVSDSQEHPYESINIKKNGKWSYNLLKAKKFYRRQDFDINSYFINGAIYMIDLKYFKKYKKLISNKHGIFVMKKINSIDIDDEEDLIMASKLK